MSEADELQQDELFRGGSPRWREVDDEPESEKDRRSHDRAADAQDDRGAIEHEAGS